VDKTNPPKIRQWIKQTRQKKRCERIWRNTGICFPSLGSLLSWENLQKKYFVRRPRLQLVKELVRDERAHKGITNQPWKMSEFRAALSNYLDDYEEVKRCVDVVKAPQVAAVMNPGRGLKIVSHKKPPQATTRNFAIVANEPPRQQKQRSAPPPKPSRNPPPRNRSPPPCPFCELSHWATDCRKVQGRAERVRKLIEQGRCFRCMRKGHAQPDCRFRRQCRSCRGDHHEAICGFNRSRCSYRTG
jgi:hypothetical protein